MLSLAAGLVAWSYAAFGESLSPQEPRARLYLLAGHQAGDSDTPPPTPDGMKTASLAVQPEEVPACNIDACTQAYRSFRASDCTYQPFEGPRRLCTRP